MEDHNANNSWSIQNSTHVTPILSSIMHREVLFYNYLSSNLINLRILIYTFNSLLDIQTSDPRLLSLGITLSLDNPISPEMYVNRINSARTQTRRVWGGYLRR